MVTPGALQDLPRWWIWALWINPAAWGMRSLSIIECLSPEWSTPYRGVAGFPAAPNETVGEAVLESAGLRYPFFWVWIDLGALTIMWAILNFASYFFLLVLGGMPTSPPPPPPPLSLFSKLIC